MDLVSIDNLFALVDQLQLLFSVFVISFSLIFNYGFLSLLQPVTRSSPQANHRARPISAQYDKKANNNILMRGDDGLHVTSSPAVSCTLILTVKVCTLMETLS